MQKIRNGLFLFLNFISELEIVELKFDFLAIMLLFSLDSKLLNEIFL